MKKINAKNVKKLFNGKKLSDYVKNYLNGEFYYFLNNNCEEMSQNNYEALKNNKIYVEIIKDVKYSEDCHVDYIIKIKNCEFELECIFDY